jgi:hypothetical protein
MGKTEPRASGGDRIHAGPRHSQAARTLRGLYSLSAIVSPITPSHPQDPRLSRTGKCSPKKMVDCMAKLQPLGRSVPAGKLDHEHGPCL